MNKKFRFILVVAILLQGFATVYGENLYVWTTTAPKQTFGLDNVQKLTFTETDLVVNLKTDSPVSVFLEDLRFFSLKDLSGPATSPEVAPVARSLVYSDAGQIKLTNTQSILSIRLFNLQGQVLQQRFPASQEASLSVSSYPAGVYLLQVTDANGISTKKIIKK
jgi:hypothetical protein